MEPSPGLFVICVFILFAGCVYVCCIVWKIFAVCNFLDVCGWQNSWLCCHTDIKCSMYVHTMRMCTHVHTQTDTHTHMTGKFLSCGEKEAIRFSRQFFIVVRSDVAGQLLPLFGKDWSQLGVVRNVCFVLNLSDCSIRVFFLLTGCVNYIEFLHTISNLLYIKTSH